MHTLTFVSVAHEQYLKSTLNLNTAAENTAARTTFLPCMETVCERGCVYVYACLCVSVLQLEMNPNFAPIVKLSNYDLKYILAV